MKKLSITLSGHRTSLTLESEFVDALRELARARGTSVAALVGEIDAARNKSESSDGIKSSNLSSAVRVFVLKTKF
jgi:predicted DNA-binding ribbon-helix-helix protein